MEKFMKYPLRIENCFSADGYPLELLPPSDIVKQAADLLEAGSKVLDVGAYHGTNGFYLADRGHYVDSIETNRLYVYDASVLARFLGSSAVRNRFIVSDFRTFEPVQQYDAAIATNVLPYMSHPETYQSIQKLKDAVKPAGYNVISVYIAEHGDKDEVGALTVFCPGELESLYKTNGWKIVTYNERMQPIRQIRNPVTGRSEIGISSFADLIALKL
jgi:SAM-dependent methyltransferase